MSSVLNMFTRDERAMAIASLERLDIAKTAMQRAGTLSGGQQQRVAIARALMQQPKVILADEPIASLDPRNAQIVMQSLHDINRSDGITVITNLHTLDTARAYCERIIGMSAGEVVFDGSPDDLTEAAARRIYGADAPGGSLLGGGYLDQLRRRPGKDTPRPEPEVATAAQP
jgi:phosphonate transport system ATP-binding protein